MAPSTLGTFLRSFTFGHVRQLEAVNGRALQRAWAASIKPSAALVIDIDSTICEVIGKHKQGAGYGYTRKLGYHPLLATRADTGEVLHARMRMVQSDPVIRPCRHRVQWGFYIKSDSGSGVQQPGRTAKVLSLTAMRSLRRQPSVQPPTVLRSRPPSKENP